MSAERDALPGASVGRRMIVGSAWMVAWRWSIRSLGLVSTVVLARLLTPEDFGLIAMAMLVVGLIEALGDTGQHLAILRHPAPTREHLDTAWTIAILIAIVTSLAMWAAAPLAAAYFGEPRATLLIRVIALRQLVGGFENVGVVLFRRQNDFARDFRYLVYQKVGTFLVTLALALLLRNYWALAIGIVSGRIFSVAISFRMHPYRPRLSLSRFGELSSFSLWILVSCIGDFAIGRIDQAAVGGLAGTSAMGSYNVALDVATAPTMELIYPTERALFPVLASLLHDPARLKAAYLDVLSAVAVASCATGVGVALVARDMVAVVLGPQWQAAVPLVIWLALSAAVWGICHGIVTVLNVTGRARLTAGLSWIGLAIFGGCVALLGRRWGAEGIAAARLVYMLLLVPILFRALQCAFPVGPGEILARTWRAVAAAAIMALVVRALHGGPAMPAALRLVADIAAGALAFPAALIALWSVSGRPPGVEASVADLLARLARRRGWRSA
ncbi:MAG: lipopolysaccharide biosynthesis protein [Dongiaceae bacterium]